MSLVGVVINVTSAITGAVVSVIVVVLSVVVVSVEEVVASSSLLQEMTMKLKMDIKQVDLSYRKRIGQSKVSGTVKGSVMAGYKIITTIFKYR